MSDRTGGEQIEITLKVFGGLRTQRPSAIERHVVPRGTSLEGLWALLADESPDFVAALRKGLTQGYLHTLINGRNTVFLQGEETVLQNGDTVAVLPPIGGG